MMTGVALFTAGLCLLVADAMHERGTPLARRSPRGDVPALSFAPLVDPGRQGGGLAIVGRF